MDMHEYDAKPGQRVDMGTIKIVPPRTGDAGTFGMATEIDELTLQVTSVKEGGPAALAGVKVDDKITAIEGHPLAYFGGPMSAQKLIASGAIGVGQTVSITLERGQTIALTSVKW
jgi:C-terminal processing protease CtpA/Prc